MTTDWNPILRAEFDKPYWSDLQRFVADERSQQVVYPPHDQVFESLHRTSYASTRVMILGQDPYHGPGQANGLCFSVGRESKLPPSLVNIFSEVKSDLGFATPGSGDLGSWADQGVLLLNTTLSVRAGEAASHHGKGWETFTDAVIEAVNAKPEHVVFILWGASARKKVRLLDTTRHTVIESAHPSPLSAHSGFFGSKPFSRANEALALRGQPLIDWQIR